MKSMLLKARIPALILALTLAIGSVAGGTIAWFTDTVESSNNVIESGNLDLEAYVVAEDGGETLIEEDAVVFDLPELWEPGAVSFANVKLVNEGNLHLDYRLGINFGNQNYVVAADGTSTEYDLSDVLKVAMVPDGVELADGRAAVLAAAQAAGGKLLSDSYSAGTLAPDAAKTYGMVIYWEPTADDNNWNVNNGKTTSDGTGALKIDLGIKATATQADVESDSFGSDYDKFADTDDIVDGDSSTQEGVVDYGSAYVYGSNDPMNKLVVEKENLVVATVLPVPNGQIAVTNVKATVHNAAVVLEDNCNATTWFIEADLTLPEGAYAMINNTGVSPQVILRDTAINGVLVTEDNLDDYLKYFKNVDPIMFIIDNNDFNTYNTDDIVTPANIDNYSEDNAPLLSNKNAKAIVFANDDFVTDQTLMYIKEMPDSDAVNVYNANITAENVFVSNVHANYFIEDASFTIEEGGKLIINEYENQVFVGIENVMINGTPVKTWDDLAPYLDGKFMNMGIEWSEHNVHNTDVLVTEENKDELMAPLPQEHFAGIPPEGIYLTGEHNKDTILYIDTEVGQVMLDDVKGTVKNAVVLDGKAGNVFLFNLDLTIPEGGKVLINNSDHCTLFIANVKVNGEYLNSATDHARVESYFEGPAYINAVVGDI